VFVFKYGYVCLREPDGELDSNRDAVVAEHESLERLMTQLVVADGRNDERCRLRRRVFLAIHNDA
jgi:hypothetical protein